MRSGIFSLLAAAILAGCLSAPEAPRAFSQPVVLKIVSVDSLDTHKDTFAMEPGTIFCIHGIFDPALNERDIRYTWFVANRSIPGDTLCLEATTADAGPWSLTLRAADPQGATLETSVTLLVNTPPRFLDLPILHSADDDTISLLSGKGVAMSWRVSDPDPYDTVICVLELERPPDSVLFRQTNLCGNAILAPSVLRYDQTYRWRVIATDRYGAADTSAWQQFSTRPAQWIPGAIIGRVRIPQGIHLSRIRIAVRSPSGAGDSVYYALSADSTFAIFPGFYDSPLEISALLSDSSAHTRSVSITAQPDRPSFLTEVLEFP